MNKPNAFQLTDDLGHIVEVFPGAGDYFMGLHIDFCCGGDRSLQEGIAAEGLEASKVLEGLNQAYSGFLERKEVYTDWAKEDRSRLIEHIINTHHQFLRRELPKLSELLFKILGVHGGHHPELFEVHKTFNLLKLELEAHLVKEEIELFPAVKAFEAAGSASDREAFKAVIDGLEDEHTAAGDLIKHLRELTDHYSLPQDACPTFALTYEKLRALEKDTFEHIHLENNILFKYL